MRAQVLRGLGQMGQVSGNGGYMCEWLMALPRPRAPHPGSAL